VTLAKLKASLCSPSRMEYGQELFEGAGSWVRFSGACCLSSASAGERASGNGLSRTASSTSCRLIRTVGIDNVYGHRTGWLQSRRCLGSATQRPAPAQLSLPAPAKSLRQRCEQQSNPALRRTLSDLFLHVTRSYCESLQWRSSNLTDHDRYAVAGRWRITTVASISRSVLIRQPANARPGPVVHNGDRVHWRLKALAGTRLASLGALRPQAATRGPPAIGPSRRADAVALTRGSDCCSNPTRSRQSPSGTKILPSPRGNSGSDGRTSLASVSNIYRDNGEAQAAKTFQRPASRPPAR